MFCFIAYITLYCKFKRDDLCPLRSPFNLSSWNPGNSLNFSGPCLNTISFQSSYFLTTAGGSLLHCFSMVRYSFICHIIRYNNLLVLICQGKHFMTSFVNTYELIILYFIHLQHFVAVVVDHFYGDLAFFGRVEGAAGGGIEGGPDGLVYFGAKGFF